MVARSKKGFTLVELMVVIAIIGILAAALVTPITNARATGQAVRCKTNLKNLAQAALSYAVENSYMPFAESYENHNMEKDGDDYRRRYRHRIGWVSCTWSGSNPWPSWDSSKGAVLSSGQAQFWGDKDTTFHSITNGSLWSHVGKDLARYLCDAHTAACRRERIDTQNTPVRRSYVMNAYFGGDFRFGGSATAPYVERYLSDVGARGDAGSLLLFAELPAYKVAGGKFEEQPEKAAGDPSDGVLNADIRKYSGGQPYRASPREIIGFNHEVSKRRVAHVAFADGHVDIVAAPDNPTESRLRDLTCLLCNGVDVPADPAKWSQAVNDYFAQ